ncbi:MAG: GNAT family N-acetyltransferase [Pirellulales bacterium]|nr:GNAT family N-acetyltransferase [Pirellulales bacterium]
MLKSSLPLEEAPAPGAETPPTASLRLPVDGPWKIALHRDPDGLAPFEPAWAELAGDVPFLHPDWALTWWRHYRTAGMQLFVLTVTDAQGALVGLAPWYTARSLWAGSEVRFLGDGEICSDYLSVCCRAGAEASVARALADWLHGVGRQQHDALCLSGVAAYDHVIELFLERCAEHGTMIDRRLMANSWRAPLAADWETYVQGLSRSRRERVRQICRKQLDTPRARWCQSDSPETAAEAWEIFVRLHQRRRESLNEPGCFNSPRFAAFHREMFDRWQPLGRSRVHWTELDGEPVVVHYDLVGAGGTVFLYQTGMEPLRAAEGPGTLGVIAALRSAIQAGYRAYDFLRGDEPYKAHWRTEPCPIMEYRITPPRGLSGWRRSGRLAVERARQWAKNRLRRPAEIAKNVT